jgi:hypothetical protein
LAVAVAEVLLLPIVHRRVGKPRPATPIYNTYFKKWEVIA